MSKSGERGAGATFGGRVYKRWSPRAMVGLAAMALAACSSDGCGCDGLETRPFPVEHYDKTTPSSMQIRVSPTGLGFIEDNLEPLIDEAIPGGLNFCLPKDVGGDTELCMDGFQSQMPNVCDDGSLGCQLMFSVDSARLVPTPPSTLLVDVTLGDVNPTIPFKAKDIIGSLDVECDVTIYQKGMSKSTPTTINAQLPVNFDIDQGSALKDLRINTGEVTIDLSEAAFDFDSGGGRGKNCGLAQAAVSIFRGTIIDLVKPLLQDALDGALRENLCKQCDGTPGQCSDRATCNTEDGICEITGTSECEALPLGMEGGLQLGTLIGDFTQEPDAEVDLIIRAGDHARANDGLELAVRTGFQHTELSDCAPVDLNGRPPFAAIPISPTINGNVNPRNNQPFMIGLGVHEYVIEQAIWSIWASGGLCIAADSAVTDNLLTTDLLATLLRLNSIKGLADRQQRDIILRVVPQKAPDVVLGANRLSGSPGSWTVEEPLMTIDWKDFDINFYGYVQDRYALLFTARVDLLLPMAIAPDGMGSIEVVMGDLEEAFTNTRLVNQGLLSEPRERVEDALPQLIGLAVGQLAGGLTDSLSFELPAFSGLKLELNKEDITSVDNDTFIALFASLAVDTSTPTSLVTPPSAAIEDITVTYAANPSGAIEMPGVTVSVSASELGLQRSADPEAYEYSWKVRQGQWSHYAPGPDLTVTDPVLQLPGRHMIEVRARRVGESPRAGDVAMREVVIDYQAPELELERSGTFVTMYGRDLTDGTDLEYRHRVHDGAKAREWSEWTREGSLDLSAVADLPARVRVEAQARDGAGHVAGATQTMTWKGEVAAAPAAPIAPETTQEPKAGCAAAAPSQPAGSLGWMLLALGAFGIGRRRKRQLAASALALSAAAFATGCGGCGGDPPATDACGGCAEGTECNEVSGECVEPTRSCGGDSECRDGEICSANICIPAECQEASDCDDGCTDGNAGTCASGVCGCAEICPEGCGEGEFCCWAAGDRGCQATPDPCAGQVCEDGFGPAVQNPGTANSETCSLDGASCGCEPLPPLPLGYHGRYLDFAAGDDGIVVAGYNQTYGDLVFGTLEGTTASWQFVDGVPASGDIEGALDGPRGGISDKGDDVGRWAAVALDGDGNAHVFYRDVSADALKYARGTKAAQGYDFTVGVLDTDGDPGWYTDVQFVGGELHVVYTALQVGEGAEERSELRHLVLNPSLSPTEQAGAVPEVLFTGPAATPCEGSCGGGEECVLATNQCAAPTEDCASACGTGSSCVSGSCQATVTPDGPGRLARVPGVELDLSVDGDGLALVFYDDVRREIGWMKRPSGGAWSAPTYLGSPSGPGVSGVYDAAGELHVAYMNRENFGIYYRKGASGAPEKITGGIRDNGVQWLKADIGEDVTLRLRADGQPEVVFHDATFHQLFAARRDASGQWTVRTLGTKTDGVDSHGFYATMLREAGVSVAGEYVIKNGDGSAEGDAVFHPLD